ncbi:MAG: hypothetical protein V4850_15500 [Myxococcota bacterium]
MPSSAPLALFAALLVSTGLLVSTAARAEEPAPAAPSAPTHLDMPVEVSITSVTTKNAIPADGLVLTPCMVPHGDPERGVSAGAVVLELQVRRGKVSAATVSSADDGVAAFGPCFERELAAWKWPVRRDDVRVTVKVPGPATAPVQGASPSAPVPAE